MVEGKTFPPFVPWRWTDCIFDAQLRTTFDSWDLSHLHSGCPRMFASPCAVFWRCWKSRQSLFTIYFFSTSLVILLLLGFSLNSRARVSFCSFEIVSGVPHSLRASRWLIIFHSTCRLENTSLRVPILLGELRSSFEEACVANWVKSIWYQYILFTIRVINKAQHCYCNVVSVYIIFHHFRSKEPENILGTHVAVR